MCQRRRKDQVSNKDVPYAKTMRAHFGSGDIRTYQISKHVIANIICKTLVSVDGGTTTCLIKNIILSEYNTHCLLTILNRELFDIVIANFAMRLSFR